MKIEDRIMRDLEKIGMKTDFELDIRGYSKSLDGRYFSKSKVVVIYAYEENGVFRDYGEIIEIAIHEAVHHYQWRHEKGFKRVKGVMHNAEFKRLNKKFMQKWEEVNGKTNKHHIYFNRDFSEKYHTNLVSNS